MIIVKSPREIALMREAGHIVATVFETLRPMCVPGVTTKELDTKAEEVIRSMGATPSFKGYGGFPGSVCISVNDTLIHGIPGKYVLKSGDIVSLDVGGWRYRPERVEPRPARRVRAARAPRRRHPARRGSIARRDRRSGRAAADRRCPGAVGGGAVGVGRE